MNLPAILFALVVALLIGALFHALRSGGGWRLLLHLALSIAGFAFGQGVSRWIGYILLQFGVLDIGMGVIGSLVFLGIGDWLSRIKPGNESSV